MLTSGVSYVHAVCRHDKRYSSCTASLLCFPWHCRYWLPVMLLALYYTTWGAAQGIVYNHNGVWQLRDKPGLAFKSQSPVVLILSICIEQAEVIRSHRVLLAVPRPLTLTTIPRGFEVGVCTGWMPFLSPNQQHQNTDGNRFNTVNYLLTRVLRGISRQCFHKLCVKEKRHSWKQHLCIKFYENFQPEKSEKHIWSNKHSLIKQVNDKQWKSASHRCASLGKDDVHSAILVIRVYMVVKINKICWEKNTKNQDNFRCAIFVELWQKWQNVALQHYFVVAAQTGSHVMKYNLPKQQSQHSQWSLQYQVRTGKERLL